MYKRRKVVVEMRKRRYLYVKKKKIAGSKEREGRKIRIVEQLFYFCFYDVSVIF